MERIICPCCEEDMPALENLTIHMIVRHDYPSDSSNKYVVDRLKMVGYDYSEYLKEHERDNNSNES